MHFASGCSTFRSCRTARSSTRAYCLSTNSSPSGEAVRSAGQPGISRLLLDSRCAATWVSTIRATAIAEMTGEPADIAAVRSFHTRSSAWRSTSSSS